MNNMIELAAIIIAIDFIKFASSIVGDAIKTTINKSIELKLEERYKRRENGFVQSKYKNQDKLSIQESLSIKEKRTIPYVKNACRSNKRWCCSPKSMYSSNMKPFVILNSSHILRKSNRISRDIVNRLSSMDGIYFADINMFDDAINELLEVPVILIDFKESTSARVVCEIIIWNIIPGINSAQSLQLIFDSQEFVEHTQEFFDKIDDYIITIMRVIKDTFAYCRLSLNESLERLKIESNILYEIGYNEIEFNKNDSGYIAQLSGLFGCDFLIHLAYNYPYSPPTIVIKKDGIFDTIDISEDLWSPDCTIGQLITAINKSF